MVLDGRNRFAACKLAKVTPSFVTYEGEDPEGYALTVNVARRNLSKGQVAMVAAQARLVSNRSTGDLAQGSGVSKARVVQASVVLTYAPDLADAVVAGADSLDAAYKVAQGRRFRPLRLRLRPAIAPGGMEGAGRTKVRPLWTSLARPSA